jgi:transmembrane sensor
MSSETRFDEVDGDAAWEAVARSLAGADTPAERDALRRHLAAHPERAALVAALDGALRPLAAHAEAPVDVEAALAKVMARRDSPDAAAEPAEARPRLAHRPAAPSAATRRWHASPLLRAAAVLVLLAGAGVLWRAAKGGPSAPAARYATTVAERETVTLPDGSTVQLGPESRLAVAAGYGHGAREVELRGEAFFQVGHDAARPFAVRTSDAVIRDLGTAFTVRSPGADGSRVAVTEGSVSLSPASGGAGQVLRAGDRGSVDAGRVVVERGAATEDDVAWTRGRLVFHDAPIARVAEELRRWYGVTLVVDQSLAGRHLTAAFEGKTADDALRVVAAALGGQLRMRGDTAVVQPTGAPVP